MKLRDGFTQADKPTMPTAIDTSNHKYNYELVRISQVNHKLFLKSKNPEVKMLGILANLSGHDAREVIQTIVNEIESSTESDLIKNKYFKQMRIFAQLRSNVEPQLLKTMQSVSTFFKVEKDVFYRLGEEKGEQKGEEKKSHKVVENLLTKLNFSDEQIAEIAEVTVEYVQEIRTSLNNS